MNVNSESYFSESRVEVTTTIVIEPDWQAKLHKSGSYALTPKDGK